NVRHDSYHDADEVVNNFFFQAEDGIRAFHVTAVQTCALPISCPPYRDPVDLQRWLPHAYRYRLPVLAAGADTAVQRQVVTDHGHLVHHLGTVPDQGRAFHRRGDFAILDQVGLTGGEHELAAGDIDLPAAEVGTVDAFLHRADDFLRIAFAGQHVGVGHPWHRQVRIGFAPTVARRRDAHQPRIQLVLDVALEHAVLDQRGALGRRTFVIDAERTTAPRQGAVVDDGAQWRGHLLAD